MHKMEYWHRNVKHEDSRNCIFCSGNMKNIAKYLQEQGLEILDIGHAWIKIKAEKNYTKENGGMTDESRLLFNLISGRK